MFQKYLGRSRCYTVECELCIVFAVRIFSKLQGLYRCVGCTDDIHNQCLSSLRNESQDMARSEHIWGFMVDVYCCRGVDWWFVLKMLLLASLNGLTMTWSAWDDHGELHVICVPHRVGPMLGDFDSAVECLWLNRSPLVLSVRLYSSIRPAGSDLQHCPEKDRAIIGAMTSFAWAQLR